MFHGRGMNHKINHLLERSLSIAYKDSNSSFKDLLKKDNSFAVHPSSLLFNCYRVISKTIMNDILQTRTNWHQESQSRFILYLNAFYI